MNFATEQAAVTFGDSVTTDDLVTVNATAARQPRKARLCNRTRLSGAATGFANMTLPVLALSMIPVLQFPHWQAWAFALTTPVVTWGASPLHHAAWTNLKHGAATMDTLVSIGVLTSYLWSAWLLSNHQDHLYLEVAKAVAALILAGRYFESRAKRQSGAALRALLDLGAKTSRCCVVIAKYVFHRATDGR